MKRTERLVLLGLLTLGTVLPMLSAEGEKKPEVVLPPVIRWETPQTREALPDQLRYALLQEVQDKPASLLAALARQAKDEGRFADAVFILGSALDSPYGQSRFLELLKQAVAKTNERMNKEARGPLYEKGFKLPEHGDFLEVTLYEIRKNETLKTSQVRYEVHSKGKESFSQGWRSTLMKRVSVVLEEEIDRLMPGNLLEFKNSREQYFIEGHFNSEYPAAVPEANLQLGLLYKDTQDYVMARHHLAASLGQRAFFANPEREYLARYALAEIDLVEGKQYDYEKGLKTIVSYDKDFSSQDGSVANRRRQMVELLFNDAGGLDRVISLYRLPADFSLPAHRQLGTLYVQRRSFEQAMPHLVFAVVKAMSHAIAELQARDYGWTYQNLGQFMDAARAYPEIMGYLEAAGFYGSLYELSMAALGYRPGIVRFSKGIWGSLSAIPEAGIVAKQAALRLQESRGGR